MRTKGNKKEQNKRRRERRKHLPKKQDDLFELIDGNWTHYPCAYCANHGAWLTAGLIHTHKCIKRNCSGFKQGVKVDD